MTNVRQAAMQALEALESSRIFVITREKTKHPEGTEWYDSAITALKAALEQPEQEPVAWQYKTAEAGIFVSDQLPQDVQVWQEIEWSKPLYTTPPPAAQPEQVDCPRCGHVCSQRPWQGLTDEEVSELSLSRRYLVHEVEAKLKERNT